MFTSCEFVRIKQQGVQEEVASEPVARAHDNYLFPEDLDGIVPDGMTAADSTDRIIRFIDSWARKQLLIREASSKIEFDEADIERKILDYRYSLMGYEYQTYYINQHLDKEVSNDEIVTYYKDNIDNFILKQHIIKGIFISVPKAAPKTDKIKELIFSSKEKDKEELNSYCLSFANTYQLEETAWSNFEEVIKSTPMAEIPNKMQFLKANKYVEVGDEDNLYFLKIDEYKISDETSPLEFEKDRIKNIIINKRKVALADKLEQEVYERAIKNNEFEVYK